MTGQQTTRRQFLTAASSIGGAYALTACGSAQTPSNSAHLTLRWWGNNSWELSNEDATILIDPWLTRFHTGTYTSSGADPSTPITVDTALLDAHVVAADQILVTHGHYDHLPDVPHIATRTGATVLGTESHCNMLQALGAPPHQLSVVSGGEHIDFGTHRIDVIPSLHSLAGPRRQVTYPGTRPGFDPVRPLLQRPQTISDLVEGGTLAYEVTLGGTSVLNLGGSNYIERELDGRRPDVLILPAGGANVVDYVPRILDLLGRPQFVFPTHWDDIEVPFGQQAVDAGGLQPLRDAVAHASPSSTIVVLDHNRTFTL